MIEDILAKILSEYGIFVTFLVFTNGVLYSVIRMLWTHNKSLSEKLMTIIENNTKVLTEINTKLGNHDS